jgi:CBS domain-containing protein
MRIRDLMTDDVSSLPASASGADAARIMWERDCGVVPIVGPEGQPIGMVTDRDLCMASYTRGENLHAITLGSVMSRSPVTCRPSESVHEAEARMASAKVRRLVVVDDRGALVGLVSLGDLARARSSTGVGRATEHLFAGVATTLAAISVPGPSVSARAAE